MKTLVTLLTLIATFTLSRVDSSAQTIYSEIDLLKLIVSDTSRLKIDVGIKAGIRPFPDTLWRNEIRHINGRIVVDREVNISVLVNNTDKTDRLTLYFDKFHFTKQVSFKSDEKRLELLFVNCVFENGILVKDANTFYLRESKVQGVFHVNSYLTERVVISDSEFSMDGRPLKDSIMWISDGYTSDYRYGLLDTVKIYDRNVQKIYSNCDVSASCSLFIFHGNKIESLSRNSFRFNLDASFRADIIDNVFNADVILEGDGTTQLKISRNKFNSLVSLENLHYDISNTSRVDWHSLLDRLAVKEDTILIIDNIPMKYDYRIKNFESSSYSDSTFSSIIDLSYLYNGVTNEELLNLNPYNNLVNAYKILFDNFKGKGNIDLANRCFVKVKDLEGKRLKAVYQRDGGFRNLFRYLLNRLMKLYTNHATDPALALVISFYIIIGFGIFYFFFPSDWDKESKPKMILHFKDFINKNDKGYFKPFMRMTYGLVFSLINAFALSLNSFVTLGFGNIPTTGIARYVCILQGFIGWFLLSIFTVALFNQVLF